MSSVTVEQFCQWLRAAIEKAIELAQPQVAEPLPSTLRLWVVGHDHGQVDATHAPEEAAAVLWRGGAFPDAIVVSVAGIEDGCTLIELSTDTLLSGAPPRVGPFIISDLPLPGEIALRPRPLTRQDLVDLAAFKRAFWRAQDALPPGSVEDERRRLWHGARPGELSRYLHTDRILVQCRGDAQAVLQRGRQVLDIILAHSAGSWPPDAEWRSMLPTWFVAACAEDRPPGAVEAWLAEAMRVGPRDWPAWVRDHPRPQPEGPRDAETRWTLRGFVGWFEPAERQWWWWDAAVRDADTLLIDVVPFDEPYAVGALKWLFEAAGAAQVELSAGVS